MIEKRDWRKKQRALVNCLREASLYRSELRIERRSSDRFETVTMDHVLDDDRGTPDRITLVEELGGTDEEIALIVEDVDEECVVPLSVLAARTWRVRLDAVTPASWRPRSRWSVAHPAVSAASHVGAAGSQPALVRVLGLEHGRWLLDVQTSAALATGDRVLVHPTATGDHATTFDVVQVRDRAVLASRRSLERAGARASVVPHTSVDLDVVIPEFGATVKVTTERFTTEGFFGRLAEHRVALPQVIGGRLGPTGIVCSLTVLDAEAGLVDGRIAKCDRVAWYNFLTRVVFGFDTRLRPADARPLTRLMQESRNYTESALRCRVALADAIATSYELEMELPSTRFRWLARHSEGHLIGHLMGIQASRRVWAAIDNVGSQSHAGRWNARIVAQWIRVFGELVQELPGEPLVQWSFSVGAGVWTEFHARVRDDSALVHAANAFVNIVLGNIPEGAAPRGGVEISPIGEREMFDELSRARIAPSIARLLDAICTGCEPGSAFVAAFEREYLKPFRRLYRRLRDESGASYLLTFSNHPTWTSLNQGHNFHYLVPLGDAPPPSKALLQAIRQDVRAAGCEPFRVMYFGAESEYGAPWIDLLLTPAAMPLAADAAEAF